MTAIVDPAGSPTVILLDSSVTINTVAAAGSDAGSATVLVRYSQINVVAITADQAGRGVKLPAGEEGDDWELYSISGTPEYNLALYDSAGATIHAAWKRRQIRYVAGAWRYKDNA